MTVDENKVQQARKDYLEGKYKSIQDAAAAYQLIHTTLSRNLDKIANKESKP